MKKSFSFLSLFLSMSIVFSLVFTLFSCNNGANRVEATPIWAIGDWVVDNKKVFTVHPDGQTVYDIAGLSALKLKWNEPVTIDGDTYTAIIRRNENDIFETQLKTTKENSNIPSYLYTKITKSDNENYSYSTFAPLYGLDVEPIYANSAKVVKGIEGEGEIKSESESEEEIKSGSESEELSEDYAGAYLTFRSQSVFTITSHNGAGEKVWEGDIEYSTDAATWQIWDGKTISSSENDGEQKLYLRGEGNSHFTSDDMPWVITGNTVYCDGDIRTLMDYKNYESIKSAPAKAFGYMFSNNSSLASAPSLLFEEVGANCCEFMFHNCTSLTSAPELSATKLGKWCYQWMFDGCENLKIPPALPATGVAEGCYHLMFSACLNLASVPVLPAIELPDYSYRRMFNHSKLLDYSKTKSAKYKNEFRIGKGKEETTLENMFNNFTPEFDTVYYFANDVIYIGEAESISFGEDELSLFPGNYKQLSIDDIKREPWYSNPFAIESWSSDNTSVATVDASGKIEAIAPGTAIITAKSTNDKTATCKIVVIDPDSYLTFRSPSSFTIKFSISDEKAWDGVIEYSNNLISWQTWNGQAISSLEQGGEHRLYMRGKDNSRFTKDLSNSYYWVIDGKSVHCDGDIRTLMDYENYKSIKAAPDGAFKYMFKNNSSLVSAPSLPFEKVGKLSCQAMFRGCTSLKTPPSLPATELSEYCYESMFQDCTFLASAPKLPATKLADNCYSYMFAACTSLVSAPELPATTLADYCYSNMFAYSGLVSPPVLPATKLATNCYSSMFKGCSSLSSVPALPATELPAYCYNCMFTYCDLLDYSTTKSTKYKNEFRIGKGADKDGCLFWMFNNFTPDFDTVYYFANDVIYIGEAESISFRENKLSLFVGDQRQLNTDDIKREPWYSNPFAIKSWGSNNASVVTVDASGKIKAKSAGTATITAKGSNGKTATCTLTINSKTIQPTSVQISQSSMTMRRGEGGSLVSMRAVKNGTAKSYYLTASVLPANATDRSITWKTSDSSIASIKVSGDKCYITAKKIGTATITAMASNGKSASCKIEVKPPLPKRIEFYDLPGFNNEPTTRLRRIYPYDIEYPGKNNIEYSGANIEYRKTVLYVWMRVYPYDADISGIESKSSYPDVAWYECYNGQNKNSDIHDYTFIGTDNDGEKYATICIVIKRSDDKKKSGWAILTFGIKDSEGNITWVDDDDSVLSVGAVKKKVKWI